MNKQDVWNESLNPDGISNEITDLTLDVWDRGYHFNTDDGIWYEVYVNDKTKKYYPKIDIISNAEDKEVFGSFDSIMLDHYEEGSFTPYWSSSGVTAPYESNLFTSASYTAQKGYYVRIGAMVLWQCQIKLASSIAYANGGANSQNLVMVIDDIPYREGNLFSSANDPAENLRLWGGGKINFITIKL